MTAIDPDTGDGLAARLHQELTASVHARRELGAAYDTALIDGFLDRVGRHIDSRVDRRLGRDPVGSDPVGKRGGRASAGPGSRLTVLSLVLAIPLSAIGAGAAGVSGLLVTWAGLVGVNAAHALGQARHRSQGREEAADRFGRE